MRFPPTSVGLKSEVSEAPAAAAASRRASASIALRSTWDIGPELADGRLVQVLPDFGGSHNIAVHAIYPSRQFLPIKVRLFIDFLADLYGSVPYWDAGLNGGDAQSDGPARISAVR